LSVDNEDLQMPGKVARENRIPIMVSHEELAAIDDWRFANRIATRSDAIRRLCQNALWLEQELNNLADDLEGAYDFVMDRHRKNADQFSHLRAIEQIGAEDRLDLPRSILLDRDLQWTSDFLERLKLTQLSLLELNNRVTVMTNAGNLRSGKLAAKQAVRDIDKRREELERHHEEGVDNMRLAAAMADETPEERAALEAMSLDDAEAYIQKKMDSLGPLEPRTFADDDEIIDKALANVFQQFKDAADASRREQNQGQTEPE
jgi:exonuclease VII large subunit